MRQILDRLADLLQGGEPAWGRRVGRLVVRLDDGEPAAEVARDLLQWYTAGMGGWQDVVLQDARGVRPEHQEFDRLRRELFASARAALTA